MKRNATLMVLTVAAFFAVQSIKGQSEVTYGILLDQVNDTIRLTAVAYPNFNSNNVTISTALFTFYLPSGTITHPGVPLLPGSGSFTDITGTWRIEKLTDSLYQSAGFDPNDLQGNDIYQCILQNSPSPAQLTSGQALQLFSWRLPNDCIGGDVQVHINDNAIQMAILSNLGININNQMSISVDNAPSTDLYVGNNPSTDNYTCPLDGTPVAQPDAITILEDANATTVLVTANDDFGNDGPSATPIVIINNGQNGAATVDENGTVNDPTDDQLVYTPNPNYFGTDTISYQICDADGDCDTAILGITITPVNDAPMVADTMITTAEDTPVLICVPISDVDHSSFSVTSFCTPAAGMVSGLTDPATTEYCLTYTPDANYTGPDTLCIEVCDGAGACDTSYVFLTVDPVNDAPTANNDSETTPEDTPKTFSVTANDTDVDGNIVPASVDLDPATAGTQTMYTAPGQGTFTTDGLGNVTFTPGSILPAWQLLNMSFATTAHLCQRSAIRRQLR
ncbi:MAG: tandem-95 repeat protein [Lewinellaceae bacterium]|nr:tandem-95 repeat protein [Lewinellaceae bacterium]